ncbi:fumarylacetoacetate hydrolase family protein [Octadecabacter sp. 1_MG-2023]|uniref:fumarylacetoacetate hydrolase family protein n=1 Tax=unclassified Octadecabacter TaxID=196158 RepID=UPI001C08DBAE|nr:MULTISPECIES: fumarylacetoacetate hydrolase family protein [unclassified Octadecabacter]MBU2994241.1 fumarylacetoacetate hydrolase family protein [Octadecabacter sp. B2R22]MDO6734470.1 fumarylacetoacetate hydrolase family protein [Octadecabacter sp. 1_MG-2023]
MAVLDVQAPGIPKLKSSKADHYVGMHRIFCVGQNYAEHVTEMGGDPKADPPIFFMKPASAYVPSGRTIPFPLATENLHHEAELVVVIGRGGTSIAEEEALRHIYGYAVGNDLTRRDLQGAAKKRGKPWDMGKGFDQSANIGLVHPVSEVGHPTSGAIRCLVDGDVRQNGDLSQMIWSVPEIIATLSGLVTLQPGDVIMTGTPSGVGPIERGQTCVCEIEGLSPVSVSYEA